MTKDRYAIGWLGWVFLGIVVAVILVSAGVYLSGQSKRPVLPPPGETPTEPTDVLRVDAASLAEWRKAAEPIGQCEDAEVLERLARGAHARAMLAFQTGAADDAEEWSDIAIQAFERLIALQEGDAYSPRRRISEMYARRGDLKQAIAFEREHLKAQHAAGMVASRLPLVQLLLQDDEPDKALEEIDSFLKEDPPSVLEIQAYELTGDAWLAQKNYLKARVAYDRAIDLIQEALARSTPAAFNEAGTRLLKPPAQPGQAPEMLATPDPPDSPRVRKLIAEGYINQNEHVRLKTVNRLRTLLLQVTDRYAHLLATMGAPQDVTPPPAASRPAASQPADEM